MDVAKQAGIAGSVCALVSSFLNPFDVTKIRLQNQSVGVDGVVKYPGLISGARVIFKEEGLAGLGRGVEASVYRELTYSTVRIGAYEPLRSYLGGGEASPGVKFLSALLSGGTGAALASPLDLVKTRMQASLPPNAPPYSNTFRALLEIFHREGVSQGLYKGWMVTSARAAVLTSAQLGSYDTIKNNILVKDFGMQDGLLLHLCAAMSAGVITTTAANPVDVIKTRYMSDKVGKYASPFDCVRQTLAVDGVRGFFKGWLPSYWRLGPHTVISLIMIEHIRLLLGLTTI